MRWIVSLVALGVLIAVFHRFTAQGPVEARATLALGFLLLASQPAGDLAHRFRLPRLTGYLIVGFAVGPSWLRLVRADELGALALIGDAAVALLAIAVGTRLTLEGLRAERATLLRVTTGAVLFPLGAVTALVLSVAPWFPITVHQPFGDAVVVALVLGVLAATSSSLVALPLIAEGDARGTFSQTLLQTSVLQDAAALILFALVLTAGALVSSPGALDASVAGTAALQLVGGVAAGAALAWLAGRVLGRVREGGWLLLPALALAAAPVARRLHLDPLVIGVAAGCTLRNGRAPGGEELRQPLERLIGLAAVPVFALAGARISRDTLAELGPWLLLLAGVRAVSLRYGLRWAGRGPSVTPVMAQHGWLGLIPQAGLAVGLAGLARRAFPEWGVSLEGLALAMIGVHLIVGPLCFRLGLRLAGEVTEGVHVAEQPDTPDPVVVPDRRRV